MLILTRKKDESIIIDRNIEIKIIGMEDGKIKIGIEAPRDKEIIRKELYKNAQEENMEALKNINNLENIKNILKNKS